MDVDPQLTKQIRDTIKDNTLLSILDALPALISYTDRDQIYRYANPNWQEWFGLKAEEWQEKSLEQVLGASAYSTAEPYIRLALQGAPQAFENTVTRRDQQVRQVQVRIVPVKSTSGEISGLVNVIFDTTEAHRVETRLQDSQNFLTAVLNSVNHGVCGVDFEGRTTYVNRAALDLLGYDKPEELLGQSIHSSVHHSHPTGEPYDVADCPLHRSATLGLTHRSRNEVFFKRNGQPIRVAYSSAPIMEQNRCVGSVVSIEDLTEQLEMQNQIESERVKSIHREKLAALGQVAAGVAHEINNPLAILAGGLQMIPQSVGQKDVLDKKLAVMQRSIDRISKIVVGLKKYTRAGDPHRHELLSLKSLLLESQTLFETRSKMAGVEVVLNLASDQTILGNAMELEQVLLNLVHNALDAIQDQPEKWIRIDLTNRGREVVLRVIDSAPMISEALEQKIFQPFFTTKPIGEGVGLGLSISKGILDQHAAKIGLDRSQKTTCFELRFPAADLRRGSV